MSKDVCKCKRLVRYLGDDKPKFHREQVVWLITGRKPEECIVRDIVRSEYDGQLLYRLRGEGYRYGESALSATNPDAQPKPEGSRLVEHKENPPKFAKGQTVWSKRYGTCRGEIIRIGFGHQGSTDEFAYFHESPFEHGFSWESDLTDTDPNAKPECRNCDSKYGCRNGCGCCCHDKEDK